MKQLKITKRITNRESLSIEKYLQDIAKYKLLTHEEEIDCAARIRQGDINALDKLIKGNLRFVVSVAKQYQDQGLTLADLINEGNIGLIKAAKRFDETKGFKFISYAVWWIRQAILQSLAENSRVVRLPLNKVGSITKVNRTFNELLQKYHRPPTANEIAKELEMAPKDVKQAMISSERHISMDSKLDDDEQRNLYNIIQNKNSDSPEKKVLKESLNKELNRVLSSLPNREAQILRYYFGIGLENPYTLDEIGKEFNLTKERVRQIKGRSLKLLKTRSEILKKYL